MRKTGLFFILLIFASCSRNNTIFEQYHLFANKSWNRFDIVKYAFRVEDITVPFDLTLSLRHMPDPAYRKLTFNVTMYTPSGEMRSKDYTLDLFDREGNALSKCSGGLCHISMPLRHDFRFSEAGEVKVEIENKYTKVDLPGIVEVGLIVSKSKDNN